MNEYPLWNPVLIKLATIRKHLPSVKQDVRQVLTDAMDETLKIAPKLKALAPAWSFKEGDGAGGETGAFPDLRGMMMLNNRMGAAELVKKFNFFFPRCLRDGKPMQYAGWFTSPLLDIFHRNFRTKIEYGSVGLLGENQHYSDEQRIHVWTSRSNAMESNLPDAAVRTEVCWDKSDFSYDLYREALQEWLGDAPTGQNMVNVPAMKLGLPEFHWETELDIDGKRQMTDRQWEKYHERNWNRGAFKLFGVPASQQEPKRPMVQERRPFVRCMAPILSWSDDRDDVTHQVFADLVGLESIKLAECKLDSSCT